MLYAGDDWAEDHHDFALVDEAGRRLARAGRGRRAGRRPAADAGPESGEASGAEGTGSWAGGFASPVAPVLVSPGDQASDHGAGRRFPAREPVKDARVVRAELDARIGA